MKKSMQSAYTDMMNNLAKSTVAVPVHLQGAATARAWWEDENSLMAKATIAPVEQPTEALEKASSKGNYHSVFSQDPKTGSWTHITDADTHEDARHELDSERRKGNKAVKIVVPTEKANWHEMGRDGIQKFVTDKLAKSSAENETDEAYDEDEKEESKKHESAESPTEEKDEKDEGAEDEDEDKGEAEHDPADIYKSLDALATRMLGRK